MENINRTYHVNAIVNFIANNPSQIKGGITNCVEVSAKVQKNFTSAKDIIFGILIHVLVKMQNI